MRRNLFDRARTDSSDLPELNLHNAVVDRLIRRTRVNRPADQGQLVIRVHVSLIWSSPSGVEYNASSFVVRYRYASSTESVL